MLRADGQNYTLFIDDPAGIRLCVGGWLRFRASERFGHGCGPSYSFDDLSISNVGAAVLPNLNGIEINGAVGTIIGGTSAAERNVISGNANAGVFVSGVTGRPEQ